MWGQEEDWKGHGKAPYTSVINQNSPEAALTHIGDGGGTGGDWLLESGHQKQSSDASQIPAVSRVGTRGNLDYCFWQLFE